MAKNYISEIKSKLSSKIHIKNPENVNNKIAGIVEGGFQQLQVVSDFDGTITKQHENGKKHMSSFLMLQFCPSVPESYKIIDAALMDKYKPIEFDPTVPMDQKKKLMEEWWEQSAKAVGGLKVSPEEMEQVVATLGTSLREHTEMIFHDLQNENVPVLVFSAGLGDTVVAVLKNYKVLFDNVKVVSNFLEYNENGVVKCLKKPIIHVLNKNEYALENSPYHDMVKDRSNVILMGDSLGDANMADGISHAQHILKIGFLYEQIEGNLPAYLDTFDIVLEDDQTMNIARILIDFIRNKT